VLVSLLSLLSLAPVTLAPPTCLRHCMQQPASHHASHLFRLTQATRWFMNLGCGSRGRRSAQPSRKPGACLLPLPRACMSELHPSPSCHSSPPHGHASAMHRPRQEYTRSPRSPHMAPWPCTIARPAGLPRPSDEARPLCDANTTLRRTTRTHAHTHTPHPAAA